jgi:hypothetical protein
MSNGNEPTRLLVPIHIDGLVVGTSFPSDNTFQWTNLAPNFAKLSDRYCFGAELGGDSGSDGNPFEKAADLQPGIHLHFRLPRALTHGSQSGAEGISFPPIPNRWLVQRYSASDAANGKLSGKAWLIRSDGQPADRTNGITWPTFHKDKAAEFQKIGACTEVTGPLAEQDEAALVTITAIGPGDPAFSAYYPASRGVLGFHDPVTGIPKGSRLSYLVTGWYADPEDDPLGRLLAEFRANSSIPPGDLTPEQRDKYFTKLQRWAKEQAWSITEIKPHTSPARLLCHGLVRGITWQGPTHNYMQSEEGAASSQPAVFPANPDNHTKAYKLAVGNTAAEAVAALLVPGAVDQDLLTALQGDLLSQSVTAAELQHELHERRFNGVQGGSIFLIRPEPDLPDTNQTAGPPKAAGTNPIPAGLRKLLRDLNARQQRCDDLSRRVEDLRWQVYALWYLWTNELRGRGVSERSNELDRQLKVAKKALATEQTAWHRARKERDASERSLHDALGEQFKTQPDGTPTLNAGKRELKYRLALVPAPPFQRPGDPAIALQGPAMARLKTWSSTDNKLACRISGQEVTGIVLAIPSGSIATVTAEQLFADLFPQPNTLPGPGGIHWSLFLEALLLDECNAATIAGLASRPHEKELSDTVRSLQNPGSTAAQQKPATDPNSLIGRLPDQSFPIKWDGNPWIPLFLVWEVSWQSAYASPAASDDALPQDLLSSRWNFGDNAGGDLMLKDEGPYPAGSAGEASYQGYAILTPSTANNLVQRLEALDKSHPLVNILKNQRVLAQSLDGFNDALLVQQLGVQLPPLDFDKWWDSNGQSCEISPVDAAINDGFDERRDTFRTAPRVAGEPFLPIRAGRLGVTRLSIVDAFGQTLKLPIAQINASAAGDWPARMLRRASSCVVGSTASTADAKFVELRPRFVQPMRLRFDWENASSHPEENGGPVCGWVLPNHLEKSLTIYSASGKPLGALQKKLGLASGSSAPAFYWLDVPGVAPVTIENQHLRYFRDWVLGLVPDDGATFSACIDYVMASTDERVPEADPGVAVLVGHPLALVRASLQFETAGLPAHRPELRAGDAGGAPVDALLDTLGFRQVKWPLRLGDLHAGDDGLVGVFRCAAAASGGDVSTSGAFYPAWGEDKRDVVRSEVRVFAVQDFTIDCMQPLQVTMLIDPQARVHATTGALPRAYLELPPEDATGARRAREVFFQTAPVLGLSPTPEMPRPSDDYGEWSWAYRPDVTHWHLDPAIVAATDRAAFADTWPAIAEGWLKLAIAPVKVLSFWVREGAKAVARGTRIHLAWSLQGAESLQLEQIEKDGTTVPIAAWDAQPFPREYAVSVQAETTYRLTAYAEEAPASAKILTITIGDASTAEF